MSDPISSPEPSDAPAASSPLHYPITVGVALAAVGVTLAWWSGSDVERLTLDARAWHGEPWRVITSVFPHLDVIHLAFNLYWLWVFGTRVEGELGHLAAAGLYLLFGAGAALAEYALFHGGVGLSGIGYGLFGLLWVLSRTDERFAGVVDNRVRDLFLAWFVLCCALTWADVWRVGNAAHAAGAVLGILLGLAMSARRRAWRFGYAAALAATMALLVAGATVGRGVVNLSGDAGRDLAQLGYLALEGKRNTEAEELYREALRLNPRQAGWWHNLGIAYQRQGRWPEAREAFQRAAALEPDNQQYQDARRWIEWRTEKEAP
jgi:membrane associated rhomboid family serine protease